MTTMITLSQWFDTLLSSIDTSASPQFPFAVRVGCVKMSSPRHPRFADVLNMGVTLLDSVFKREPITETNLCFVFPERFMSVHEQQKFMYALLENPNVNDFRTVDIITSSALMLGDYKRENVVILSWDDDHKHSGERS
mgnify:CR=1 FL=1